MQKLGPEIKIKAKEIPMGLPGVNRRTVPGYMLANDLVLMESVRDNKGRYVAGAGMDGMYLRTSHIYVPVRDASGEIQAPQKRRTCLTRSVRSAGSRLKRKRSGSPRRRIRLAILLRKRRRKKQIDLYHQPHVVLLDRRG
jgi:hypothetical protein